MKPMLFDNDTNLNLRIEMYSCNDEISEKKVLLRQEIVLPNSALMLEFEDYGLMDGMVIRINLSAEADKLIRNEVTMKYVSGRENDTSEFILFTTRSDDGGYQFINGACDDENSFSKVIIVNHAAVVADFELVSEESGACLQSSGQKNATESHMIDLSMLGSKKLQESDRFKIRANVKAGSNSESAWLRYSKYSKRTLYCELKGTAFKTTLNIRK